jgi:hypothetical protein
MFKTIRDFLNFKPICFRCGNPISVQIKQRADFSFEFSAFYRSLVDDNKLSLIKYKGHPDEKSSFEKKICKIDLDTNQNFTHVKEFQSFFSTNTCELEAMCYNKACQNNVFYFFKSSKLYVDSKNNKLYQIKLDYESICGFIDDKFYILSSRKKDNSTILTNDRQLVGVYPYMNLNKIDSPENALKKIKTLLVFG